MAKPHYSPRSWPRGSSLINDNPCVISVTGQKNSVHVTGQGDLNPAPAENSKVTLNLNVDSHVANAHIVTGLPQRKGVNPTFCLERDFASLYILWGELSQNQLTNASVLSLPGETLKTDGRNLSIIGSDDVHIFS